MHPFKNWGPAMALLFIPIAWFFLTSIALFGILQQTTINTGKLDEIIVAQKEDPTLYSVELETFSKLDGRLIYVPLTTPNYFTAVREYNSQVQSAFASCEAGEECLDSVHVWIYEDTAHGTYIRKDTALTPYATQ
jgi:hypothetical protein